MFPAARSLQAFKANQEEKRSNQGNRQHPSAKDILEPGRFKDVVNEDVVV